MAVRTPAEAVAWAKIMVKNMPFDTATFKSVMCDKVMGHIWQMAPWVWSVAPLEVVDLAANVSEYTLVTPPNDLLYLLTANVADSAGNLGEDLKVVSKLPSTITQVGPPSQVAYEGTSKIRVFPKPPTGYSKKLVSLYKKTRTPITDANIANNASLSGTPDEWFHVFMEGVLWQAYLYGDDPRAGSAVTAGGQIQYSGQLGVFMSAIEEMKRAEKALYQFPGVVIPRG